MTTIKHFDRAACKRFQAAALAALEQVAKDHGVTIQDGAGRFDAGSFTMKFVASTIGEDGKANDPARTAFGLLATRYGLEASDLDREFSSRGERYRITGLNTKARKMPIQAVRVRDGARFKFAPDIVKMHLSIAA